MKTLADHAAELGVKSIVLGMAHRGRINVLANLVRKPLETIFSEFQIGTQTIGGLATGDVKYHLGVSYNRPTRSGKLLHLSLLPNPSHLETVNPVVEGMVAAKQFLAGDDGVKETMPLLIHGDGSFAGQGVVFETIMMTGLPKYSTGGTIHVIINNQISFTTDPPDARPGEYCTDVALTIEAPIFHVNGDDPDAVCWVFQLAAEWRQKFHKDIVVDVVCYRRFGHNEIDQPSFTQPLMYKAIANHPKTLEIYSKSLIHSGIITAEEYTTMKSKVNAILDAAFEKSKTTKHRTSWLSTQWQGVKNLEPIDLLCTGITRELFNRVGKALYTIPPSFKAFPMIRSKLLPAKQAAIKSGKGVDWATAEGLAFGSLLCDGFHVRLSGQDVERGTFSHRHAVLHDQDTNQLYLPLNHIEGKIGKLSITNSFLSEYAELGYELGFSLELPNALVVWEAQFGDFSNGAQIILDQFISSAEQKWLRQTGIVLLLPHGMEGMGPEHSSARLERFLQMSDQNNQEFISGDSDQATQFCNWVVMNITTPANFFHALRRQVIRGFRKPLIVMSPKSLLRHPLVKSDWEEFSIDRTVKRVIPEVSESLVPQTSISRLIFCSGKVFYDLFEERAKREVRNIAIVRIEELAPFPFGPVCDQVNLYPQAEVVWCQEEHMNQGAWNYVYFFFETVFKHTKQDKELKYVGRPPAASPATGNGKHHRLELDRFIDLALTVVCPEGKN
eukprot:TRINITY_DN4829_c0_g1_i14.p1 TRINITY_DN4829_c0_g1~~TRINITY_DN4829_c0_g1_i14.p1  ORF type:complete len:727 (-),score=161.03 TRINITY_DN4829_c0_g1_i14:104-2284(-)